MVSAGGSFDLTARDSHRRHATTLPDGPQGWSVQPLVRVESLAGNGLAGRSGQSGRVSDFPAYVSSISGTAARQQVSQHGSSQPSIGWPQQCR